MEFAATYTTVDAHAGGEPLRIVTGGVPRLPGATILAKRRWAREHLDHVRRALMWEPRGHGDMYGAYLTEGVTPEADLGVIFMHNEGYSDMCGHGIVALATVVVAQGLVARRVGETRVGIDTPAGFVEAFVAWDGRRAGAVRFRNVASFLHTRDLSVETPSFGPVVVDVAFGGAFYAYVDAERLDLEVDESRLRDLVRAGDEISRAVERACDVVHPFEGELRGIYGTILAGPPRSTGATQRNVCVFADRQVDRSPTGTGTAGRVAQLVARGELDVGDEIVNESIIGSRFTGRALERVHVGPYEGVVPEVGGRAAIIGFSTWVVDPDDELSQGFFLR
ncbi:proline racemase family protein [soil metagenome]